VCNEIATTCCCSHLLKISLVQVPELFCLVPWKPNIRYSSHNGAHPLPTLSGRLSGGRKTTAALIRKDFYSVHEWGKVGEKWV